VWTFQSQLDTIAGFAVTRPRFGHLPRGFPQAVSVSLTWAGKPGFHSLPSYCTISDRLPTFLCRVTRYRHFSWHHRDGVLDYALWPRRSIVLARHHSAAALRMLAKLTSRLPDPSMIIKNTLPLRLSAEKDLAAAQDLVIHAILEPDARFIYKAQERTALREVIKDASNLSGLLQVRNRYRLLSGQQFGSFPDKLQTHSRAFDAALANELENTAMALLGEHQETGAVVTDVHALLKQSYTEYHDIESLPADLAMEWELRFKLDHQIMDLVEHIQKRALDCVSYRLKAGSAID